MEVHNWRSLMERMAKLVSAHREKVISDAQYLDCLAKERFRECDGPCTKCPRS